MSLKCIDLFSGAGGFSVGLKKAGFNIVGAVEVTEIYAKTHAINFPEAKTISKDIRLIQPKEFANFMGIKKGTVDLVAGGPPCQTFSSIGSAKIRSIQGDSMKDHRNYLFENFFDYVAYFKPPVFIMENVPTLKTRAGGVIFQQILDIADSLGYKCQVNVLNAVEYGVPQTRKRLFIVGTRNGAKFVFPQPTHVLNSELVSLSSIVAGLKAATTVHDAISDLPTIQDGARFDLLPYSRFEQLTDYQMKLRNNDGLVGNNVCRVSNDRAKKLFPHMSQGQKYMDLDPEVRKILPFREDIFHDRLKRLSLTKPSWTVLAHIGMDGYMYIHPTENRTLSVREAARIQSFPDWFKFVGNMREQYIQVGNAVPPLLANALAKNLYKALN